MSQARISIKDDRKKRWFWIDNEVFNGFGAKMQPNGIAVYCALVRHANNTTAQAWPSIRTIADEVGISPTTANAAIKRLEELELIAVERPGAPRPNIYTILESPTYQELIHNEAMYQQVAHDVSADDTELNDTKHIVIEEEDSICFDDLKSASKELTDQYPEQNPEAIADASKQSSAVDELARQLAPPIDWVWGFSKKTDKKLVHAAQQLLTDCKGDIDGALEALDDYCASDGDWARANLDDPHGLATLAARRYQKVYTRRHAAKTNEWREASEAAWQRFVEERPGYDLDEELRAMGKEV